MREIRIPSLKILIEHSLSKEDITINCAVIELDRGYLVLISDQNEYGLGTIVMSGPPMSGETRALSSGIPVFGFKNSVLSKMVSEMIAAKLKKSCLVLFHVKEEEHQNELIAKAVVDCVKQTLDKVEKISGK